jgi:hypothetical protein
VLFDQTTNEQKCEKQIGNLGGVVVAKVPTIGLYLVEVPLGNENTLISALRTVPGVIYAEPDLPAVPHASRPNEWLSNSLLALNSWYLKLINAPRAWDIASNSNLENIELGIIDFGFRDLNLGTVDLQGRLQDSIPEGTSKHGTLVTALSAATGNNNFGNVGVNWWSKVRLIQTDGANAFFSLVTAAAAGSEVVNMSLGVGDNNGQCSVAEAATKPIYFNGLFATVEAITTSLRLFRPGHRFLSVNSAGNDNCVLSGIQIGPKPANVMVVGATNFVDKKASYSDHGPLVDLGAPGGDDVLPVPWIDYQSNEFTFLLDGHSVIGTSISAPLVAGAAALVWAREPRLSAAQVARRLKDTARHPVNFPADLGAGVLDVGVALDPSTSIIVDGDPADWANINPLLVDPAGDGPFDLAGIYHPESDMVKIYVTNDTFNIYFLVEFVSDPPVRGTTVLFLNADLDNSTGCPGFEGAEFIMVYTTGNSRQGVPFDSFVLGDWRDCSAGDDFPQGLRFVSKGRFLEAAISIEDLRTLGPGTNGFTIWAEGLPPATITGVEFVLPPATYTLH